MQQRTFLIYVIFVMMGLFLIACDRQIAVTIAVPTSTIIAQMDRTVDATTIMPDNTPSAVRRDVDWQPIIVASSPQSGQEQLLDGAITLRFDQEMDQSSVEAAFELIGEKDSIPAGAFSWPHANTMIFTPANNFDHAQQYRVRVKDSAMSVNGKPLHAEVNIDFETIGYLEVGQIVPAANTTDVDIDSDITVFFNRPVVPLVATAQQKDMPIPIAIDPPIEGDGSWVSTTIYRFEPAEAMDGATEYTITVSTDLKDISGNQLENDVVSRFSTAAPQLISFTPAEFYQPVDPQQVITATFNMPMDRSSSEKAITLSTNTPLTFSWAEDSRSVAVRATDALPLGNSFTLNIATDAQSSNKKATLLRPDAVEFESYPFPRVEWTYPEQDIDNAMEGANFQGTTIGFASPMNMETVEERITIIPEPDDLTYQKQGDRSIMLLFDAEPETRYTITVPADVEDIYGNRINDSYRYAFTMPSKPPFVALNLPHRITQISTAFPSTVDLLFSDAQSAEVTLFDYGNFGMEQLTQRYFDRIPPSLDERRWSVQFDGEKGSTQLKLADGDTLPTGVYGLTIDSPQLTEESSYWQMHNALLLVADVNLVIKEFPQSVLIWATDMKTADPLVNQLVTLYYVDQQQDNTSPVPFATVTTDENGVAFADKTFLDLIESNHAEFSYPVMASVGTAGQPVFGISMSNWNNSVEPYNFGLTTELTDQLPQMLYLFTDRPLYRPGDTVYVRGLLRNNNYGRYRMAESQTIQLQMNNWEGDPLQIAVETDERGMFSSEFVIPDEWPTGVHQLNVANANMSGAAYREITVAEFRKPDLLVDMVADSAEQLRDKSIDVTVSAAYFFGGTATGLNVRWQASYTPYLFPWDKTPYYSFVDGNSNKVTPYFFDENSGGILAEGEGKTNDDGQFIISLSPDQLIEMPDRSQRLNIEATITDSGNIAVSENIEIIVHGAETYVGIRSSDYAFPAQQTAGVELIAVDWQGETIADTVVDVVFYERKWVDDVSPFDANRTIWQAEDSEVARQTVTTNQQDKAVATFIPKRSGSYIARATVTDDAGRIHTSQTDMWVYGAGANWRADDKDRKLEIISNANLYDVGDEASLLIQSPYSGTAWLTIERGDMIEQRLIELDGNPFTMPIKPEYAPNVFVTVAAVKGVDDSDRPFPDMRYGIVELAVNPSQFMLDISITTEQETFEPRDTVVYDLRVTDEKGEGVETNLSVALVDAALLSLRKDTTPLLLDALYGYRPLRSQIGSGLFMSGEGLEVLIPEQPMGGMGGGGGGAMMESAVFAADEASGNARRANKSGDSPDSAVRQDFRDTAYWSEIIRTDIEGTATISVTLPDNLTTWQLNAKAISEDTQVGDATDAIVATKKLLVRPITPRFLTAGDQVDLAAIVNNNTGVDRDINVMLTGTGITIDSTIEQTIFVPDNGEAIVRWPVIVQDADEAELLFTAVSDDFRDVSKPTVSNGAALPIMRFDAEDIVATSGVLDNASRRVEAILLPPLLNDKKGSLHLDVNPSLAAAVLDTFEALKRRRDQDKMNECAYWYMHQLLPNVAMANTIRALDLENGALLNELDRLIAEDIEMLIELQRNDGGWGFCRTSRDANAQLSAIALLALGRASTVNDDVPTTVIENAVRYLTDQITPVESTDDANQQAYFLYALSQAGQIVDKWVDQLLDDGRGLLDPYAKGLLILADPNNNAVDTLLSDLNTTVNMSGTGASWENDKLGRNNLNSHVRGTAIIVEAMTTVDKDNELLPMAVRWLMEGRQAQLWQSDNDTAWAIIALGSWMRVSAELEADYTYNVRINDSLLGDGLFNSSNITSSQTLSMPLAALTSSDINFVDINKTGDGRLYYTAHVDAFVQADTVSAIDRGFSIERAYYDATCDADVEICVPIMSIAGGQQVRVELTVIVPRSQSFVTIEDPLPSGADAIDPTLDTSAGRLGIDIDAENHRYGSWSYFNEPQFRDNKVLFTADYLPAGTYQYTYHLQPIISGRYQLMPAIAKAQFRPEVFGRSDGSLLTITVD